MRYLTAALVFAVAVAALIGSYLAYTWLMPRRLIVSTTTSLYATGLLDAIADGFKAHNPNVDVVFVAVGSGEALRRATQGDADVVLVHAPSLELAYIKKGVISERRIFAYNYFLIVGPKDDPARIEGLDPVVAFKAIFEAGDRGEAVFVSRGDNSGTHVRELAIWRRAGLDPRGRFWYVETGSGMAETLRVADEKRAYTLTDVGVYLKLRETLEELKPLLEGGKLLMNIYSGYLVTSTREPELARRFLEYLVSDEAQGLIGGFGVEEYGGHLFYPVNSTSRDELEKAWNRLTEV